MAVKELSSSCAGGMRVRVFPHLEKILAEWNLTNFSMQIVDSRLPDPSTNFTFELKIFNAIVRWKFIVYNSERIILFLCSWHACARISPPGKILAEWNLTIFSLQIVDCRLPDPSTNFTFELKIFNAIVRWKFIVYNSERIILFLCWWHACARISPPGKNISWVKFDNIFIANSWLQIAWPQHKFHIWT